ncbi:hypothetical protein LC612_13235 [Nostoc sp. CHAB 5834]|nr:hypothetical protein [Nostoc sp. CHAB 5834]
MKTPYAIALVIVFLGEEVVSVQNHRNNFPKLGIIIGFYKPLKASETTSAIA